MKSKLLLFALGFLMLTLRSNAQEKFIEGHVVLLNGDTLKGFLIDPNWEKSPNEISFKNSSGSVSKFNKGDILSFEYNTGTKYKRIITTIDKTPTNPEKIDEKSNKSTYISLDTIFAEVLVIGKCNLYYAMDETAKRHYFIEKDKNISELTQKIMITEKGTDYTNKEKTIRRVDVYKGQLSDAFRECTSMSASVNKAKLERGNLIELVNGYNSCSGGSSTYVNKNKVNTFEMGAEAGLSMTQIKFSGNSGSNLEKTDFPASYNPSFGLWFMVASAKNKQRLALYGELLYRAYKTEATYVSFGTTTYNVNMSYLKINCALRYQHPGKKIKPFGQAGLGYGIALKKETPLAENLTRNFEACLFAGGGVRFGKTGAELRYEHSNGFSEMGNLKSSVSTLFFLLSYKF